VHRYTIRDFSKYSLKNETREQNYTRKILLSAIFIIELFSKLNLDVVNFHIILSYSQSIWDNNVN